MISQNLTISVVCAPDETNPFLIINKPRGLPSAPLTEGEDSALTQAVNLYPELKKVKGKKSIEYGLLHRIDTVTEGLVLIAATQEAYDNLEEQQLNGNFIKTYSATCKYVKNNREKLNGYPDNFVNLEKLLSSLQNDTPYLERISASIQKYTVNSLFRPYGPKGAEVRPVLADNNLSGKAAKNTKGSKKKVSPILYSTDIYIEDYDKGTGFFKVKCQIKRGYRHQVRCHLAWCNLPIAGDPVYDADTVEAVKSKDNSISGIEIDVKQSFDFTASGLNFINPATGKRVYFGDNI